VRKVNANSCKLSDAGASYQLLHRAIWLHKSILLVLLISMGVVGLATAMVPAQTRAYVLGPCSNTVSIIDIATNTVVATVSVGTVPARVAITPDGTHAYVINQNSSTVSVIATEINTVVATIPSVGNG
jgi:YVTN family beta-propeller protein